MRTHALALAKGKEGLCFQLQRFGHTTNLEKCYTCFVTKLVQSEEVKFRSDLRGIVSILKSGEDTDLKNSWARGSV